MPTNPIRRVETIVTGVAGSPYYVVGHFAADTGTAAQCINAWHTFVTGSTTGPATGFPVGATVRTSSETPIIDPVDGAILEVQTGATVLQVGGNNTPMLPPATQLLVRWRTGNYVNRREVRGRTNLPCALEEASTTAGQVEASVVTALSLRGGTLINNTDTVFVVWSKKNGLWWAANSASCWDKFSVLRSRRD